MPNFTSKKIPGVGQEIVGGVGWRGKLYIYEKVNCKYKWYLHYRFCGENQRYMVQLFETREDAEQFMDGLDNDLFGGGVGTK